MSSKPVHGEVYSIQHYVIKFVSDLIQVGGVIRVLRFPPPINWRHDITEILLKVALYIVYLTKPITVRLFLYNKCFSHDLTVRLLMWRWISIHETNRCAMVAPPNNSHTWVIRDIPSTRFQFLNNETHLSLNCSLGFAWQSCYDMSYAHYWDSSTTRKCRSAMNKLLLYINLCPSVKLDVLSAVYWDPYIFLLIVGLK